MFRGTVKVTHVLVYTWLLGMESLRASVYTQDSFLSTCVLHTKLIFIFSVLRVLSQEQIDFVLFNGIIYFLRTLRWLIINHRIYYQEYIMQYSLGFGFSHRAESKIGLD